MIRLPRMLLAAMLVFLAPAVAAACSDAPPERPATTLITLSATGPDGSSDLADAVRRAPPGATITLRPGRYRLSRPLDVFRSLRLVGAGAATTEVVATAGDHVLGFNGHGTLAVQGITLRFRREDGRVQPVDVLRVMGGRIALERCRFAGSRAPAWRPADGAGARLSGDTTGFIDDCRVADGTGAGFVVEDEAAPLFLGAAMRADPRCRVVRSAEPGPTSARQFERFLEPIILEQMTEKHIPGVVVVLVRDRDTVFERGWGYADAGAGTAMDPRATKLLVASIAKVVTATAIMQLVEAGRLDLRDDVDSYLGDHPLPGTIPEPVTVGDLLTHSAGVDDALTGTAARDERAAVPLGDWLAQRPMARFAPPGAIYSYTNNGPALAGLVVERASGESFASYVQRHIFAPLGMRRSSFEPDLDDPALAVGYDFDGERFVARPHDVILPAPSAGLVTSGADMGRFMLAHLNGGAVAGRRILTPTATAGLQSRAFVSAPGLRGVTYAFRERDANGYRALEHTGDWGGQSSMLFLMPSQDLGLFIHCNRADAGVREAIVSRFINRYYPRSKSLGAAPEPPGFAARSTAFAGVYRRTRYAHDTFEKILQLDTDKEITVATSGDALEIDGVRYVEIEPLLFRRIAADGRCAFATDERGDVAYLLQDTRAYERLAWYETSLFNRRLLIAIVIVFLVTLTAPLVTAVGRRADRRRETAGARGDTACSVADAGRAQGAGSPGGRAWGDGDGAGRGGGRRLLGAARPLAALVAGLDLAFLAGLALALSSVDLRYGVPWWLVALLCVPLVTTVLTLTLPPLCLLAWIRREWSPLARVLFSATTVAALAFVWFALTWNLLGPRL